MIINKHLNIVLLVCCYYACELSASSHPEKPVCQAAPAKHVTPELLSDCVAAAIYMQDASLLAERLRKQKGLLPLRPYAAREIAVEAQERLTERLYSQLIDHHGLGDVCADASARINLIGVIRDHVKQHMPKGEYTMSMPKYVWDMARQVPLDNRMYMFAEYCLTVDGLGVRPEAHTEALAQTVWSQIIATQPASTRSGYSVLVSKAKAIYDKAERTSPIT